MLWPSFARQILRPPLSANQMFFQRLHKRAGVIILPAWVRAFTLTASLRADGRKR